MSTLTKSIESQFFTSSTLFGLVAGLSLVLSAAKYLDHINLFNTKDQAQVEDEQYFKSIEQQISSLEIVKELRNDPSYKESRGYENIKEDDRKYHLTAGTLQGKGKLSIKPLIFYSEEKQEGVYVVHIGEYLCGHKGIAHGGLLSTVMDEILSRTVVPCLPDKNGVTAYLHVNFRKPCKPDQILIGRGKTTKLENRKGFVEGSLETLEGVKVVDANALFISLKALKL